MTAGPPCRGLISSIDELRACYRAPTAVVRAKKKDVLDHASRAAIEACPLVLVATAGADGSVDVSPRGGPPGFVQVLDDHHVALADLNGNNLVDSLTNVVTTGQAGLLFVLPGRDETVRLNGPAWVTRDPAVLGGFARELRPPKVALVVGVHEVFVHCGKAFRRGHVWDPATWAGFAGVPGGAEILCEQGLAPGMQPAELGDLLEKGYAHDLALDRAEPGAEGAEGAEGGA